jgi:hypothetical protein
MLISRATSSRPSAIRARSASIGQFLALKVQLPKQRERRGLLVRRQLLLGQPASSLDPEQVTGRTPHHQIAMQDRVDLVLQPGPLPHDLRAAQHLATQRAGRRIRQPHRRQEIRGQQASQDLGIDLVFSELADDLEIGLAVVVSDPHRGMVACSGWCDRRRR